MDSSLASALLNLPVRRQPASYVLRHHHHSLNRFKLQIQPSLFLFFMVLTIIKWYFILIFSLLLTSCAPQPNDMSKFPGEYVYRSTLGQVESLTINADGTLRHEIYDDENTYVNRGQALFGLDKKWTFKSGNIEATLLQTGLCYPTRMTESFGPVFYPQLYFDDNYCGKGPGIILNEVERYWLKKIKDRKDILSMKFGRE